VEAAVATTAAKTATALVEVVVEATTAPEKVAQEAELSNGARRHSAKEEHSPRAPPGSGLEEVATVAVPDGVGTPAPVQCSVQEVAWPSVALQEALGRCEA
jgi:hypothetical protein